MCVCFRGYVDAMTQTTLKIIEKSRKNDKHHEQTDLLLNILKNCRKNMNKFEIN